MFSFHELVKSKSAAAMAFEKLQTSKAQKPKALTMLVHLEMHVATLVSNRQYKEALTLFSGGCGEIMR